MRVEKVHVGNWIHLAVAGGGDRRWLSVTQSRCKENLCSGFLRTTHQTACCTLPSWAPGLGCPAWT